MQRIVRGIAHVGGARFARRSVVLLGVLTAALCAAVVFGDSPASAAAMPRQAAHATKAPAFPLGITCATAENHVVGVVCVHTQPGAKLSIRVVYCRGRVAQDASLKGTNAANDKGDFAWTWTPNATCIGTAHAYVTARYNGKTVRASTAFEVQREMGI